MKQVFYNSQTSIFSQLLLYIKTYSFVCILPLLYVLSDDNNECEKYDFTTTAELSGSDEEEAKKKFIPTTKLVCSALLLILSRHSLVFGCGKPVLSMIGYQIF